MPPLILLNDSSLLSHQLLKFFDHSLIGSTFPSLFLDLLFQKPNRLLVFLLLFRVHGDLTIHFIG